jgi:hypothetical protein
MAIIFFCTRNSGMQFILERIFGGNVFALITVFLIYFAVSLILAIIDVAQGDETKRHLGSYFAFIYLGVYVLLYALK